MIVKENRIQSKNQMLFIPDEKVRLTIIKTEKNKFRRQLKTKELHKIKGFEMV